MLLKQYLTYSNNLNSCQSNYKTLLIFICVALGWRRKHSCYAASRRTRGQEISAGRIVFVYPHYLVHAHTSLTAKCLTRSSKEKRSTSRRTSVPYGSCPPEGPEDRCTALGLKGRTQV